MLSAVYKLLLPLKKQTHITYTQKVGSNSLGSIKLTENGLSSLMIKCFTGNKFRVFKLLKT